MPLINGQKMACEPCIRGHRSTKCSHANERLMVPVRRPGRPLSSCPHPPSRPCLCAAAVTAAIPKKQKCRCDTSQPEAAIGQVKTEATATAADVSPSQASSSSSKGAETPCHRVQKSVSTKSKAGKKPIDTAALERMDASQVNIVSAFDAGLAKSPPPSRSSATTPGSSGYAVMRFVSPEASVTPGLSQSIGPGPQNSVAAAVLATSAAAPNTLANGLHSSHSPVNGHSNGDEPTSRIHSVVQSPPQPAELQARQKSCCCSKTESTGPEQLEAMRPAPTPETRPAPAPAPAPTQEPPPHPIQEHYQMNGGMMNPMPAQMPLHHSMYPFYPHTSVFAYPPHCGSYLQPLQPEQWRHLMANTAFSMPVADPTYDQQYQAMPLPAMHQMTHMNGTSWTSHQCGCGDSCQCIGCASHPYNEATQNYVRSAWNMMMMEESSSSSPPQQQHKAHSHHHHDANRHHHEAGDHGTPMNHTPLANGSSATSTGASTPAVKTGDDAAPSSSATESAGPAYEEQILSANDFFFVSYPFRMCEGEMASCSCGDDCACDGCLMHSRPVSQAQL